MVNIRKLIYVHFVQGGYELGLYWTHFKINYINNQANV